MSSSSYYKSLIAQNYSDIKKEEEKINATLSKIAADNGIKFSPLLFFSSVAPTVKSQIKNGITVNDELEKKDDVQTTYTEKQNPNEEKVEEIIEVEESEEVNEAIEVVEEEKNNEIFETASEENDEPVITAKAELISADNYLKKLANNDGNVVIDGYSYNVEKHTLTDPSGNKMKVDYLLPKNANISHLNTLTVMGGNDDYGVTKKNSRWNGLGNYLSNCLVVSPQRDNKDKSYSEYPVASATTFGNLFTGNKKPINTIIGTSAGGGAAVKIAANNQGVYKKVISCNYEPLSKECGKSIDKGGIHKLTDKEIECLACQDIELTYINCSGDPNISTRDNYSGYAFEASTPHFIDVVNGCTNKNANFKMQFLSNSNDGYATDKYLGTWTSGSDCVSFQNNINDYAKFLGVDVETAKKIYGHGDGCYYMLKYLISKGC